MVDDDDLLRSALCQMLADRGFRIVGSAGSGAGAIELAPRVDPDVVIMDFRMAGMDGVEAIQRIRQACPSIQALMFTAYDDQALSTDATRAGAVTYIVKGSDPELIVEALDTIGHGLEASESASRRVRSPASSRALDDPTHSVERLGATPARAG